MSVTNDKSSLRKYLCHIECHSIIRHDAGTPSSVRRVTHEAVKERPYWAKDAAWRAIRRLLQFEVDFPCFRSYREGQQVISLKISVLPTTNAVADANPADDGEED